MEKKSDRSSAVSAWGRIAPVVVMIFESTDVQAYFDPNAGGAFFQLLFPLFAAIAAFWSVVRNWVRKGSASVKALINRTLKNSNDAGSE